MYSITVVGAGYVGLVTAACLADFGNKVVCVDNDPSKVERLRRGEVPFFEPGLPELVTRNVQEGRLRFESDLTRSLKGTKVVFIAVGTPPRADGSADTSAIYAVAKTVARHMDGYLLVVQKSTAPIGTARHLYDYIRKFAKRGAEFDVASNPEFLREGSALETFMRPDRVVIGAESPKAAQILKKIHDPLFLIETPMVVTTLESAELIKYASNCFLATKISFINEVANLCEAVGADVKAVAKGIGMDRRIGSKFLHSGPGYGGSCFPKDTLALSAIGRDVKVPTLVVDATIAANDHQMDLMVKKILAAVGKGRGKRVGLLGLAFKPNTDDLRAAPALRILAGLKRRGIKVRAFDPVAQENAKSAPAARGVEFAEDAYDAARGADALAIVTEWNEFRNMDLARLKRLMRKPVLLDLRNIYDPEAVEAAGLTHIGVGRGRPGKVAVRKRTEEGAMIEGVVVKKLKVIPDERGLLMEMMRDDDAFFQKFGQVYLSVVYPGVVKGWHYHKKQTDHFVFVKGMAKVALYDSREGSRTKGEVNEFFMGENNPILLVIPPGVLHGMKGIGTEPAYLVNTPTEHYVYDQPDEFRFAPDDPSIPYDWSRKDG